MKRFINYRASQAGLASALERKRFHRLKGYCDFFPIGGACGRQQSCIFLLLGSDGKPGSRGSRAILSCVFVGYAHSEWEPRRRCLVPGLCGAGVSRAVASRGQLFLARCGVEHLQVLLPRGLCRSPEESVEGLAVPSVACLANSRMHELQQSNLSGCYRCCCLEN